MISTVILTFEDDTTGAREDTVTLENCSQDVFGITDITKLLLKSSDKTLAWTLTDVLRGAITKISDMGSLLIVASIGHGSIDLVMDILRLESGKSNIQWKPFNASKTTSLIYIGTQ
jgi:hypothetical protein